LSTPASQHNVVLDPLQLFRHLAAQGLLVAQGPHLAPPPADIKRAARPEEQWRMDAVLRGKPGQPRPINPLLHGRHLLPVQEQACR